MDLRQLTTFQTIARVRTVSAAATELLVSQPALSRQLQQLERDLGLSLFARSGRRLELTAAGRHFLEATNAVLAEVEAARALAASLSAGRLTHVRAAAPSTTLNDVFAPFLAELRRDDPLVTVDEADYDTAVRSLGAGLDLVVVTAPPPQGLETLVVADLPVWAYVPSDDPMSGAGEITLADLASRQLVTLDSTARPRRLLDDAFAAAGVAHAVPIECRNAQVAQALAAAGRGVAVVSDDPRFGLIGLSVRAPHGPLTITLHAAWDGRHHAADELHRLASRLRDWCAARYPSATARR